MLPPHIRPRKNSTDAATTASNATHGRSFFRSSGSSLVVDHYHDHDELPLAGRTRTTELLVVKDATADCSVRGVEIESSKQQQ
jgi:hypothetical protein